MSITPRHITHTLLILLIIAAITDLLRQVFTIFPISLPFIGLDIFAIFVMSGLLWAARRDWAYAEYVLILFIMPICTLSSSEPYITQQTHTMILVPPVLAMVLLNPRWIMISAVGTILLALANAGWHGAYADPVLLVIYGLLVGSLILGWLVAYNAARKAEYAQKQEKDAAAALLETNVHLEQTVAERSAEIQENLALLQEQAQEQARLLSEVELQQRTIRSLKIPIIPVNATTFIMPLIGAIDMQRFQQLHYDILQTLERRRVRTLILDLSGIPMLPTMIAQGIIQVAQAAQLLGSKIVLVGIRPDVARTMVGLGLDMIDIRIYRDLQSALMHLEA